MKHNFLNWWFFILLGGIVFAPQAATAEHGLTLFPAKVEIIMGPSESVTREFTITNHTAALAQINVSGEDFGSETDRYSLLPYLTLPRRVVDLAAGASVSVPITVSLPPTPPAGSLSGAVIFSFTATRPTVAASIKALSRLGALVFVRPAGVPTQAAGNLAKFGLLGGSWPKSDRPPIFYLNYLNQGNIYLNPYGVIVVTNRLTSAKLIQKVDPWFVLPGSSRIREITFRRALPSGWYRADLELNRGYADIVDERTVSFFIWSWSLIISLITSLIILSGAIWFVIIKLKK